MAIAPAPVAAEKPELSRRISLKSVKVGTVGRKSYEAKKAESLHLNIQAMIEKHGIDRIVLCTLTFAENLKCLKVAQKRFDSINSRLLGELFDAHITAVHRGTRKGRIHYHLIAVCKQDVRSGFDFEAWQRLLAHVHLFGRKNALYRTLANAVYATANPALKTIWKTFRERAEGYGFGMVETYPIRSNAEAIGRYVGSYVRTGAENRQFGDKRMRTLRYSMGRRPAISPAGEPLLDSNGKQRTVTERVANQQFSWLSGPAETWRAGCRLFSLLVGVDYAVFADTFGKRWAWDLRREITILGRFASRASEKLYAVAASLAHLSPAERFAQTGEFCRQLYTFERAEGAHV